MLTPNELVIPFGGSYVCANFGENRSRNATARVLANGQTDRLADANRFYNLSHAICYSYGTDNNKSASTPHHQMYASAANVPFTSLLTSKLFGFNFVINFIPI